MNVSRGQDVPRLAAIGGGGAAPIVHGDRRGLQGVVHRMARCSIRIVSSHRAVQTSFFFSVCPVLT